MKAVAAVEQASGKLLHLRVALGCPWQISHQPQRQFGILPGCRAQHLVPQRLRRFIVRLRLEPVPNCRALAACGVEKRALDCRNQCRKRAGCRASVQESRRIGVQPVRHDSRKTV